MSELIKSYLQLLYPKFKHFIQLYIAISIWSLAVIKYNLSDIVMFTLSLIITLIVANIDETIKDLRDISSKLNISEIILYWQYIIFPLTLIPSFIYFFHENPKFKLQVFNIVVDLSPLLSNLNEASISIVICILASLIITPMINIIIFYKLSKYLGEKYFKLLVYIQFILFTIFSNIATLISVIYIRFKISYMINVAIYLVAFLFTISSSTLAIITLLAVSLLVSHSLILFCTNRHSKKQS